MKILKESSAIFALLKGYATKKNLLSDMVISTAFVVMTSTLPLSSSQAATPAISISNLRQIVVRLATSKKFVFAHYVMSAMDYGGSVAGCVHDIQDAQAAGVDGFVLNVGSWDGNYIPYTANMFKAANMLNNNFKLFFSIDEGGGRVGANDIQTMVKTYAHNPAYFLYQGKPVLSTWGGDGTNAQAFWQSSVLSPLKKSGFDVSFLPGEFNTPTVDPNSLETAGQVSAAFNVWWQNI